MKHIIVLFCSAVLLSACVKNNPEPVWLSIDKWVLEENPDMENPPGELTQNLSEVWVYVDNKVIGVFELPCKIPVLTSGNKKIQLYPTIRNNGISATKKIYPFCEPVVLQMDLVAGQTYNITPTTRYYSTVQIWQENFSSNTIALDTDDLSNASITVGSDPDITQSPGNGYGHIHLTTSDSLWIGYTIDNMDLPQGEEVYLEIDYRNSNSLLTGVLAISNSEIKENPDISLNPQDPSSMVWKKIYIDLKEIVSYSTSAEYFKIYLRALLDNGDTEGDIYIDNINVVHF